MHSVTSIASSIRAQHPGSLSSTRRCGTEPRGSPTRSRLIPVMLLLLSASKEFLRRYVSRVALIDGRNERQSHVTSHLRRGVELNRRTTSDSDTLARRTSAARTAYTTPGMSHGGLRRMDLPSRRFRH